MPPLLSSLKPAAFTSTLCYILVHIHANQCTLSMHTLQGECKHFCHSLCRHHNSVVWSVKKASMAADTGATATVELSGHQVEVTLGDVVDANGSVNEFADYLASEKAPLQGWWEVGVRALHTAQEVSVAHTVCTAPLRCCCIDKDSTQLCHPCSTEQQVRAELHGPQPCQPACMLKVRTCAHPVHSCRAAERPEGGS